MKNAVKILSIVLVLALCTGLVSCGEKSEVDLWENAIYTEDTQLGSGKKTLIMEVVTDEKSIVFEIKSDKETVGEALLENKLIEGKQGAYGIYIKKVNGIEADYDKDQSYWSFSRNGEYMPTGVDSTEFKDKEHFQLVYTK